MTLDARTACAQWLARWTTISDPPRMPSGDADFWKQIPPTERGAAMDMLSGIMRRRLTLDTVIGSVSRRGPDQIDPVVRSILWVGAFQLLFSDHVADYAAVDSSVRLAAKLNQNRAGGFINAILRSIQRLEPTISTSAGPSPRSCPIDRQRWIRFNRDIFPSVTQRPGAYWSAAASLPIDLVKEVIKTFDAQSAVHFFIDANIRPPVTCRLDRPEIMQQSSRVKAHARSGWALIDGGINGEIAEAIERGDISPQDPTAGLAADAIIRAFRDVIGMKDHPIPEILDLCAGRGTKTVQLAMKGLRVAASDIAADKLEMLRRRESTLRTGRIQILPAPPAAGDERRFAAVLVDVPCSNTGVLARRPEVRWRILRLDMRALIDTQLSLLARGAEPAERLLVYSTCSVLPIENRHLIDSFLSGPDGRDWYLDQEAETLPSTEPHSWHDGGYFAMLRRRSSADGRTHENSRPQP